MGERDKRLRSLFYSEWWLFFFFFPLYQIGKRHQFYGKFDTKKNSRDVFIVFSYRRLGGDRRDADVSQSTTWRCGFTIPCWGSLIRTSGGRSSWHRGCIVCSLIALHPCCSEPFLKASFRARGAHQSPQTAEPGDKHWAAEEVSHEGLKGCADVGELPQHS